MLSAITFTQVLALLGGAVALKTLFDLASFFSLYLQPPTYARFLRGNSSYALVTGASDGIGKAFAKELYAKGFNLILHGRNEYKLNRVREEIASAGAGQREVRLWIADATDPKPEFSAAIAEWQGLDISIVIHNVGGTEFRPEK